MISAGVLALPPVAARWRSWAVEFRSGRQPQWPVYTVAAVGWAVLVALEFGQLHTAGSASPYAGHGTHTAPVGPGSPAGALLIYGAASLGMLAVMAPLVAWNVRYAALRAPEASRGCVTGWVICSWAAGWLPLLVGTALLAWGAAVAADGVAVLLGCTVLAIAWQWSARKRRSIARCDRVLAPPLVRRAARIACARYGLRLGWDCGTSCAPMMVVMMAAGHGVLAVAPLTALAWYERRRRPHHDPRRATSSVVLAGVGIVAMLTGLAA